MWNLYRFSCSCRCWVVARAAQRISRSNVITDLGQPLHLVTVLVGLHAGCLYLERGVDVDVLDYLKYLLCVAQSLIDKKSKQKLEAKDFVLECPVKLFSV